MLGPSEEFSKTFTNYYSSAMGLQSDREKIHLLLIPAVPHAKKNKIKKIKKRPFLPNSRWFLSLGGGASRFLGEGVISLQDSPVPSQNSNSM